MSQAKIEMVVLPLEIKAILARRGTPEEWQGRDEKASRLPIGSVVVDGLDTTRQLPTCPFCRYSCQNFRLRPNIKFDIFLWQTTVVKFTKLHRLIFLIMVNGKWGNTDCFIRSNSGLDKFNIFFRPVAKIS